MQRIVLIGPPASGKGTQCRRIQALLDIPTLGTGNLLRREVESGSELGQEVEGYLNRGAYVPDALMMQLVQNWLRDYGQKGWLLDGFPRTLAQAQALEEAGETGSPTLAIGLDVPEAALEQRITKRRECSSCGATFTVGEEEPNRCQDCGGELVVRSDDNLENFRTRYANYKEHTQPLFDYYASQGKLLLVDGMLSPDAVYAAIEKQLTEAGA